MSVPWVSFKKYLSFVEIERVDECIGSNMAA